MIVEEGPPMTGLRELLRYARATAIVGDILKIRAHDVGLDDMARVEMPGGERSLAQTIQLEGDELSLRVCWSSCTRLRQT
jgi:hypothetical protein